MSWSDGRNDVSVVLKLVLAGMGSSVCSRNSKMCGLMMVSSGTLWSVIQAKSDAFLMPALRCPGVVPPPLLAESWGGVGVPPNCKSSKLVLLDVGLCP
jgi:hypothetical protein